MAPASLRRRRALPVQRLLARLAVRPPEANDRVGRHRRHVSLEVVANFLDLQTRSGDDRCGEAKNVGCRSGNGYRKEQDEQPGGT